MASKTEICNLALQKLGAGSITSINQDTKPAKTCLRAYDHCRLAELEEHPWRFAHSRESLAADADEPAFGKSTSYTLPSDFLRLLKPYPEDNSPYVDYEIEDGKIYTDMSAPLEIRYIKNVTDESKMPALFVEVLACRMALQMCEELTQSNSKKSGIADEYKMNLAKAKRVNAIQSIPAVEAEDEWLAVRD